jgi:hypothetical protein
MGLFQSAEDKRRKQQAKLLDNLTKGMRLLLPADPGRDQMLGVLRQYHPLARRAAGSSFHADGSHLYLNGPVAIAPELAAQAQLPPGITAAYFPSWVAATNPGGPSRREVNQKYREKATYLIGGLAARFGGLCVPRPEDVARPLHADIYVHGLLDHGELPALVSRHTPGQLPMRLQPLSSPQMAAAVSRYLPDAEELRQWPDQGVVGVSGDGAPWQVECWPPDAAAVPMTAEAAKGSNLVAVLAKALKGKEWSLLVLRTGTPAGEAEPALARALGTAALGIADEIGGVCVDLFGFRVRDPADLVIRPAG